MLYMNRRFILAVCLLLSFSALAQNNTASPYSFGGLGLLKFRGTVDIETMGGMGVFSDSIHTNVLNPATYANLRFTNYTVGGEFNSTNLKEGNAEEQTQITSLDYLIVGIPMGRFGASFGLYPYSAVGYDLENETADQLNRFTGTGGLTKVYLGVGYNVFDGLNRLISSSIHQIKAPLSIRRFENGIKRSSEIFSGVNN